MSFDETHFPLAKNVQENDNVVFSSENEQDEGESYSGEKASLLH